MRKNLWLVKPIAMAVSSCFGVAPAFANPTGPQVMSGSVQMQGLGTSQLKVTNSPNSIIHWQGFSIRAGQSTQFLQQSASSAVLNRVVGADISQIHGQLLSNGRVFLINPAGIVVGAGGMIDTAGFVGSTLNMLDGDFLAGKLKFQGGASAGSIVNQGWIKAGQGGNIVLVAPGIENNGVIQTDGGQLTLAAGRKMTIGSLDLEGVQFEIQAPTDSVVNVGQLLANGGAVGVFAGTLRHSGDIRANALTRDEGGRIVLKAHGDVTLAAGSSTSASGKVGGNITIQSHTGTTLVSGNAAATGSEGKGGDVRVLGVRVGVIDQAVIDASGERGGGQILVGGDFQGRNANVQNASQTLVASGATLRADAVTSGDGGQVIVWADGFTRFNGTIFARGGAQGGDGGFAETSGKEFLSVGDTARVHVGSPLGRGGRGWLLDPKNIRVAIGGTATDIDVDQFSDTPMTDVTISPATIFAYTATGIGGPPLTLQANNDITIADAITLRPDVFMTAQAGRSIILNASITAQLSGVVTLVANETNANGVVPAQRDNNLPASITMAAGTAITTGIDGGVSVRIADGAGRTGADAATGNMVLASISSNVVNISHEGTTAGNAILRADAAATLTGVQNSFGGLGRVFVGLESSAGTGASIGTAAQPIRIDTPILEARNVNGTSGIFFNSIRAGALEIGGTGAGVRGVQTPAGGPIVIEAADSMSQLAGAAVCGAGGGTGGPVCAGSAAGAASALPATDTVTIRASDLDLQSPVRGREVSLLPTAGTAIELNSAARLAGALRLSQAEISNVDTGLLRVGEIASGAITITNAGLNVTVPLNLTSGGAITGATAAGTNDLTVTGALSLRGTSIGTAGDDFFITPSSTISATATTGDIFIRHIDAAGMRLSNYTLALPAGRTVRLTNSGGGTARAFVDANVNVPGANVILAGFATTTEIQVENSPTVTAANLTFSGNATFASGAGTATFATPVTVTGTSTFTSGTNNFDQGATLAPGVAVNGGTANFNALSSVQAGAGTVLTLAGGLLSGTDTLTVNGAMDWTGGGMSGVGGATVISGANTLTISGATAKSFTQRTLTVGGAVTWTGDSTVSSNGGIFNLNGGMTIQGNGTWASAGAGSTPTTFNNTNIAGITRNTSAGTAALDNVVFGATVPARPIAVQTGTLRLGQGLPATGAANASAPGPVTIAAGATLQLAGAVPTLADGLSGAGALVVSGGAASVTGAATQTGAFTASGGTMTFGAGATYTPASMTISGGTATFNRNVTDAGTLTVSSGTVDFNQPAQINGALALSSTGTVNFNAASRLAAGGTFSGGTLGGTGTVTLGVGSNLAWTAGNMNGTGTLATETVGPSSTLTISGATARQIDGGYNIDNAGSVSWTGTGNITATGNSAFTNRAGWFANNDSTLGVAGAGTYIFDNLLGATVTKAVSGTSIFTSTFNNSGTVTVNGGVLSLTGGGTHTGAFNANTFLRLGGGTHNLQGGSTVAGVNGTVDFLSGTVNIAGGVNLTGTGAINVTGGTVTSTGAFNVAGTTSVAGGTLNINTGAGPAGLGALTVTSGALGGTRQVNVAGATNLSGSGTLGGAGTKNLAGALTWSAGTIAAPVNANAGGTWTGGTINAGQLTVAALQTLTVGGGAQKVIDNAGQLINAGTINWSGIGGIDVINGSSITNQLNALFDAQGDQTLQVTTGATTTFNNAGTFRKSAGAGTMTVDTGLTNTGTGTLDVAAGTMTVNGPLTMSGGTLGGAGNFIANGLFNWSGGTISGSGLLTTNAATNITGSVDLQARTWNNAGNVTQVGGNRLTFAGNAVINNQAGRTWTVDTPVDADTFTGNGTFNNAGTFTKNGPGADNLSHSFFNNTGLVDVAAGTLILNAASGTDSGDFTVAAGAALQFSASRTLGATADVGGAGTVRFANGTVAVSGTYAVGTTTVFGGTANFNVAATTGTGSLGNGTLGGSGTLTVNGGAFDWTGGASTILNGTGTLNIAGGSSLNISGTAFRQLFGGYSIDNSGTVTWTSSAEIRADTGASTIINRGQWNAQNDSSLNTNGGTIAFTNMPGATFTKSGAGTTSGFTGTTTFNNQGTVNVTSGTLNLAGGGTDTNAFNVAAGATLQFGGSTHDVTGAIQGVGNLTVSAGALNANGLVTTTGAFAATGGTTTFAFTPTAFAPSSVAVSGGAIVNFDRALNDTGTFSISSGTANFGVTSTVTGATTIAGGTVQVNTAPNALNLGGPLTFSGGTIAGGTVRVTNTTTINAGTTQSITGGGALSTDVLNMTAGALTIGNLGTLDITGSAASSVSGGAVTTATPTSGIRVTGSGTLTFSNTAALTSNGGLNAALGAIVYGGATQNFNDGTQFVGVANGNRVTSSSAFNGVINSANLVLESGTFSGAAELAGVATTWTGGTITGTYTNRAGIAFNVTGAGAKTLDGASLINNGTVGITGNGGLVLSSNATLTNNNVATWTGGTTSITVNAGSTITNSAGATFNLNANATNTGVTGAGTFQNNGILNSTAPVGSTTLVGTTFNNTGAATATVNVNGGTLQLTTGGTHTGAFDVDANTTLSFGGGTHALNAGSSVSGLGTVSVNSGRLNVNTPMTIANPFVLTGGNGVTLGGTGNLTLAGPFAWSGGADIDGAGMLTTTGVTTISDSNNGIAKNWTVSPTGRVDMDSTAHLDFFVASSTVRNQGTFNMGSTVPVSISIFSGSGTIVNEGMFNKTAAGTQSLLITTFTNAAGAALNVSAGTLAIPSLNANAGTIALSNGATLTTNGNNSIDNTGTISGVGTISVGAGRTLTSSNTLSFSGPSTLTGNLALTGGMLAGAGPLNVTGGLTWTGGTISSSGGVTVSGTTAITGGAPQLTGVLSTAAFDMSGGTLGIAANTGLLTLTGPSQIANATLNNAGTVRYSTPGNDLLIGNGGVFNNQATGTFNIQGDIFARGAGNGAFNNNGGTLLKTGGSGTDSGGFAATLPFNNNGGLLDSASGALELMGGGTHSGQFRTAGNGVNLNGGTHTFTAGSSFDGPFIFLNGGATLNVSGNPTINSSLVWNGPSTITGGTLTVAPTGVFNIGGTGTRTLTGATVNNQGVTDYVAFGAFDLSIAGGSTFVNSGGATFNLAAGTPNAGISGAGTFQNNGTLNSTAAGITTLIGTALNNAGTVNVDGGTLRLAGGGTHTGAFAVDPGTTLGFSGGTHNLNAGSSITGTGTVTVDGGMLNVGIPMTIASPFVLTGGTTVLGGSGNVTLSGPVTWSQGADITGAGMLTTSGVTTISDAGNGIAKNWTNAGTGMVNMGAGAALEFFSTASTFTNQGAFNLASTGANPIVVTSGSGAIVNQGAFNKSGAGAQSIATAFNNTTGGTLSVSAGTLAIPNLSANAGAIRLSNNAVLTTNGANGINNTGTLAGNGTFDVGLSQTVTNNGVVAPGLSPGTLVINGNYVQGPSGLLAIELGGLQQGVSYDLLRVTGNAALGGTLSAGTIPGFPGSVSDRFEFMTYASRSGDFSAFSFPLGSTLTPLPGATVYTLLGSVPPNPVSGMTLATDEVTNLRVRLDNILEAHDDKEPPLPKSTTMCE